MTDITYVYWNLGSFYEDMSLQKNNKMKRNQSCSLKDYPFYRKKCSHTSIIKEWMKFLYSQTDNNTKWLVSIWRILTIQFSYQGQISVIIFFLLLNLKDNKNRRSTNVALTSIKNIKVLFYSEMIKLNYSKFIQLNEILVLID